MANKAIVQVCETKIDLGLYFEVRYEPSLVELKETRLLMNSRLLATLRIWTIVFAFLLGSGMLLALHGYWLGVWMVSGSLLAESLAVWLVSRKLDKAEKLDAIAYGAAMLIFGSTMVIMIVIKELAQI